MLWFRWRRKTWLPICNIWIYRSFKIKIEYVEAKISRLFPSGLLTNISNILQRESRASPDLGKSSAMHMATELFIKPSAVIGCFLAVRMIFSVFSLFLSRISMFSPIWFSLPWASSSSSIFADIKRNDTNISLCMSSHERLEQEWTRSRTV